MMYVLFAGGEEDGEDRKAGSRAGCGVGAYIYTVRVCGHGQTTALTLVGSTYAGRGVLQRAAGIPRQLFLNSQM
jgi:hypothetical protein